MSSFNPAQQPSNSVAELYEYIQYLWRPSKDQTELLQWDFEEPRPGFFIATLTIFKVGRPFSGGPRLGRKAAQREAAGIALAYLTSKYGSPNQETPAPLDHPSTEPGSNGHPRCQQMPQVIPPSLSATESLRFDRAADVPPFSSFVNSPPDVPPVSSFVNSPPDVPPVSSPVNSLPDLPPVSSFRPSFSHCNQAATAAPATSFASSFWAPRTCLSPDVQVLPFPQFADHPSPLEKHYSRYAAFADIDFNEQWSSAFSSSSQPSATPLLPLFSETPSQLNLDAKPSSLPSLENPFQSTQDVSMLRDQIRQLLDLSESAAVNYRTLLLHAVQKRGKLCSKTPAAIEWNISSVPPNQFVAAIKIQLTEENSITVRNNPAQYCVKQFKGEPAVSKDLARENASMVVLADFMWQMQREVDEKSNLSTIDSNSASCSAFSNAAPSSNQLPVSQLQTSQLPVSQLPVSQLPVSQLPVSQSPLCELNTLLQSGLRPNGTEGKLFYLFTKKVDGDRYWSKIEFNRNFVDESARKTDGVLGVDGTLCMTKKEAENSAVVLTLELFKSGKLTLVGHKIREAYQITENTSIRTAALPASKLPVCSQQDISNNTFMTSVSDLDTNSHQNFNVSLECYTDAVDHDRENVNNREGDKQHQENCLMQDVIQTASMQDTSSDEQSRTNEATKRKVEDTQIIQQQRLTERGETRNNNDSTVTSHKRPWSGHEGSSNDDFSRVFGPLAKIRSNVIIDVDDNVNSRLRCMRHYTNNKGQTVQGSSFRLLSSLKPSPQQKSSISLGDVVFNCSGSNSIESTLIDTFLQVLFTQVRNAGIPCDDLKEDIDSIADCFEVCRLNHFVPNRPAFWESEPQKLDWSILAPLFGRDWPAVCNVNMDVARQAALQDDEWLKGIDSVMVDIDTHIYDVALARQFGRKCGEKISIQQINKLREAKATRLTHSNLGVEPVLPDEAAAISNFYRMSY